LVIFETLLKSTKITSRTSVSHISRNEVLFMNWGEGWNSMISNVLPFIVGLEE